MRFGSTPLADCEGAILAHSVDAGGRLIRKGTVLSANDLAALTETGHDSVVVARLDPTDIHEDIAALRLAEAVAGASIATEKPFTGRSNLRSEAAGVLVVDRDAVDLFNRVDPAITLATLPAFAPVAAGEMVATVKIIPFGVASRSVDDALSLARAANILAVAPYHPLRVGLVSTVLPSLKLSVLQKTFRATEARLRPAGATLLPERRVAHHPAAVAEALRALVKEGAELFVIFGASAMVDSGDVVPAAIAAAGGRIVHLGMPVDPGNLLVLGELAGKPVLGAPGCARSPKENGFDWILRRLLAGLPVTSNDISGLGVGGLLTEIPSRPQPRQNAGREEPSAARIAALVLAAGQGSRMGGGKLTAEIGGKSLVRHVVDAALASKAASVTVVTGHAREAVEAACSGAAVRFVHNEAFAEGLSTSLRAGVASLDPDIDGVLVMLADMPFITPAIVDRLIAAFDAAGGRSIVVPTHHGKRGNPVLWSRDFFQSLQSISGDAGARHLIGENMDLVAEVEIGPEAALDLDTPEALAAAGGRLVKP